MHKHYRCDWFLPLIVFYRLDSVNGYFHHKLHESQYHYQTIFKFNMKSERFFLKYHFKEKETN